jgi:hypothetical protein
MQVIFTVGMPLEQNSNKGKALIWFLTENQDLNYLQVQHETPFLPKHLSLLFTPYKHIVLE